MERTILKDLEAWKTSPRRKPLVLKGARQVGKTWALREFARRFYENCAYVSLEEIAPGIPGEFASFFEATRDPRAIVKNLSFALGCPIEPGATLLVLDEIQDCPAAIGALKAFCEEAPEYHVACAGSLLGVRLSRDSASFPVGKVEFLEMHPMTFAEHLRAAGEGALADYLDQHEGFEPVAPVFERRLAEQLSRYLAVGGMPEAQACWAETGNAGDVDAVLSDLLDSYERDFAKHGGKGAFAKISQVWHSIPGQLARENRKFMWGLVRDGARAREYEDAVEWVVAAGLLSRVRRNAGRGIPLAAYDDPAAFKCYSLDVGLLRRQARLPASAFSSESAPFIEFKGAFAENYVLQELLPVLDAAPRYWTCDKPRHEVDFLLQVEDVVVPVEVKSGAALRSPSLRYYTAKHADATPLRVRFSMRNLALDDGLLNIPLYMADRALPLMKQALSSL